MSGIPKIPGRAVTYEERRAVFEKILLVWTQVPYLRLGQLIDNAMHEYGQGGGPDLFTIEDDELVVALQAYGNTHDPWG